MPPNRASSRFSEADLHDLAGFSQLIKILGPLPRHFDAPDLVSSSMTPCPNTILTALNRGARPYPGAIVPADSGGCSLCSTAAARHFVVTITGQHAGPVASRIGFFSTIGPAADARLLADGRYLVRCCWVPMVRAAIPSGTCQLAGRDRATAPGRTDQISIPKSILRLRPTICVCTADPPPVPASRCSRSGVGEAGTHGASAPRRKADTRRRPCLLGPSRAMANPTHAPAPRTQARGAIVSAGPDQPMLATPRALDEVGEDWCRERRLVELEQEIIGAIFARLLAPTCADLDRAGIDPVIRGIVGRLVARPDDCLFVECEGPDRAGEDAGLIAGECANLCHDKYPV